MRNYSVLLHWAGCLLGTALVALFAVFAFGGREEPPPLTPMTAALAVMLFGFVLAWWCDWLGALVSLSGFVVFYAMCFVESGKFPGGWVFPLCVVPGVLCLIAAWLRRKRRLVL